MAYVAGKSIEVMRNGKPVRLKPGELVPEAATWKNLKSELAWGRVKEVPDSEVKAKKATKSSTAPKPKDDEPSGASKNGAKRKRGRPPKVTMET